MDCLKALGIKSKNFSSIGKVTCNMTMVTKNVHKNYSVVYCILEGTNFLKYLEAGYSSQFHLNCYETIAKMVKQSHGGSVQEYCIRAGY